ncbi:hypothetical protein Tco_0025295 [Tanacetum coccineum]
MNGRKRISASLKRGGGRFIDPYIFSFWWMNQIDMHDLVIVGFRKSGGGRGERDTYEENSEADKQQQRDPNRDRRRAANKYRFSRGVLTEVDEEQIRQTAADRSGRCIAHNHINTKMNESRQQQTDQADSSNRFSQSNRFRQIINRTADSGKQNHPDKRGKTIQYPMHNQAKQGKQTDSEPDFRTRPAVGTARAAHAANGVAACRPEGRTGNGTFGGLPPCANSQLITGTRQGESDCLHLKQSIAMVPADANAM